MTFSTLCATQHRSERLIRKDTHLSCGPTPTRHPSKGIVPLLQLELALALLLSKYQILALLQGQ